MTKPRQKWIPSRVYPGMFSDERAVEVAGRSFFVDQQFVRKEKGETGEVFVTIVETEDGHRRAVLPTSMRESVPLGA